MVKKGKTKKARKKYVFRLHIAPLKSSFFATGIIGFIISALWVFPVSPSWGFTFLIFFAIMVIAAIISMTYGPPIEK